MPRHLITQAATTDALSWSIFVKSDFDLPRIDIAFDAAPTTEGSITVTKDSHAGAAYDQVIMTVDPVDETTVVIEDLDGFVNGDKVLVEYANPDGVEIVGSSSVEIAMITRS